MKTIFIYALLDPLNGRVRYIGKSIRPELRLQNHMNEVSNCHRSHWLQSLKKQGIKPEMRILEAIKPEQSWQERERFWIAIGKNLGWPLTNNTNGGDGVEGLPEETRKKMAQTWIGRKHKPETIAKLKEIRKGKSYHTAEGRRKVSEKMKGREITWGATIADKTAKLSDTQCSIIRTRLLNGEHVKDLAIEYGVHRTTISKVKMNQYKPKSNNQYKPTQKVVKPSWL
jgi:group I intron endonuclease